MDQETPRAAPPVERVWGRYTEVMSKSTSTEVLDRAKRRLEVLTPARLRAADEFLAYLEGRESDEATEELLGLPGFREALEKGESEARAGDLTPAENLRRSG